MAISGKEPDRDPWANYDPEKVREGMEAEDSER